MEFHEVEKILEEMDKLKWSCVKCKREQKVVFRITVKDVYFPDDTIEFGLCKKHKKELDKFILGSGKK